MSIAPAHTDQIMTARIMERGLSSGRIDDNEEAIRKRLVTYRESTMPIIKEFEARGKLREVNSNQTIGTSEPAHCPLCEMHTAGGSRVELHCVAIAHI